MNVNENHDKGQVSEFLAHQASYARNKKTLNLVASGSRTLLIGTLMGLGHPMAMAKIEFDEKASSKLVANFGMFCTPGFHARRNIGYELIQKNSKG